MNPGRLPVASELFRQWQSARGNRDEPASRPFSRDWEQLLDAAGIVSAVDRNDAERDVRALEQDRWLHIKPVRHRPHLIQRLTIPLEQEARWREAFGFVPPSDTEARRLLEFPWVPQLEFVRSARLQVPFGDLQALHAFLGAHPDPLPLVPIKERSLQIFGDEKRLDALLGSTLFREERLDLQRDLGCEIIGEPLAWKRGPTGAVGRPVIVIENAATWHSYCRWNRDRARFSAVVYGGGNRFADGVRYLTDLFEELDGSRRVLYFGDLDPPGLQIPQRASRSAEALGLPFVEPHLWSYRQLLRLGQGRETAWTGDPGTPEECAWLGELADPVLQLLAAGKRVAQEHLGWEYLQTQTHDR
ncbi:MAG: hypothetical protein H7A45_14765 [Verrucomicrobiales bacterium]|nr:hypothetical protein [Verrucomicrobiales bacterium]MCP5528394.1 hypothetical protein [Verrucomicrobiales bacterium]